jgi:hypothetical protein
VGEERGEKQLMFIALFSTSPSPDPCRPRRGKSHLLWEHQGDAVVKSRQIREFKDLLHNCSRGTNRDAADSDFFYGNIISYSAPKYLAGRLKSFPNNKGGAV